MKIPIHEREVKNIVHHYTGTIPRRVLTKYRKYGSRVLRKVIVIYYPGDVSSEKLREVLDTLRRLMYDVRAVLEIPEGEIEESKLWEEYK